ncbi:MAG: hypothetical protein LUD76_05265 [Alistipes sp.]|nr:hypothetical protein [Alistipes sp.]
MGVTPRETELMSFAGIRNHYLAQGCRNCYYTGYNGRKAIYEVIPLDDELSEAARNNVPDVQAMLKERNITTLRDEGLRMVMAGETSFEEVIPF